METPSPGRGEIGVDEVRGVDSKRKRVLVLEEEYRVLRFVRVSLQMAGYDVLTSTDADGALNLVESERPAIVLVDPVPGIGGLETLRRICKSTRAPVIVMSIDDSVRGDAFVLGAADFIAKPFDTKDLVRRIAEIVGGPMEDGS